MTSVPYNEDAEASLVGAMLLSRDAIRDALAMVAVDDFHNPRLARAFEVIVTAYDDGEVVDPLSIAANLDAVTTVEAPDGGWKRYLLRVQASTYASSNVRAYAELVIDAADRRRVMAIGTELVNGAQEPDASVEDLAERARTMADRLVRLAQPRVHPSFDVWRKSVDMSASWIMPNILEHRDRVILVAPEGLGKSHACRTWGLMAACGVHWFTEERIPPRRVLYIDVENAPRQIVRNSDAMWRLAEQVGGWDRENYTVIPLEKLDLNSRPDRIKIESFLLGHRPDLLVIGPIYKVFSSDHRRTYEENAMRATSVIDDWRAQFDCAVLMEHHAPKGSGGHRQLDPLGSSAWMRWPETGLTMSPDPESGRIVKLGHFRGQRERRPWPTELERGLPGQWPWRASSAYRMQHGTAEPDGVNTRSEEPF